MKKIAKLFLALLIVCCLVFAGLTAVKVQERVEALTAQLTAAEAERDQLLTENAALNEQLIATAAEYETALAAKDAELTEANSRLEHAESTLNDALIVVQSILEGLDLKASEEAPAEEELPETEEAEAAEVEVTEEAIEEAPADEEAAEETETPAEEEGTEEVPADEQPAEETEAAEEVPAE